MKDLVDEGISILNSGNDLMEFGHLLHEAWQAKRSLSGKVSNPQVDGLMDQAMKAGALGGKLTGAGGGGFMLLFVPPDSAGAVKPMLGHLIHVPFKFEFSGSQIIFFEPETRLFGRRRGPQRQEHRRIPRTRRSSVQPDGDWPTNDRRRNPDSLGKTEWSDTSRFTVCGAAQTLIGSALVRRLKSQGFTNAGRRCVRTSRILFGRRGGRFFAEHRPEYVFFAAGKSAGISGNQKFPAELMLDNLLVRVPRDRRGAPLRRQEAACTSPAVAAIPSCPAADARRVACGRGRLSRRTRPMPRPSWLA